MSYNQTKLATFYLANPCSQKTIIKKICSKLLVANVLLKKNNITTNKNKEEETDKKTKEIEDNRKHTTTKCTIFPLYTQYTRSFRYASAIKHQERKKMRIKTKAEAKYKTPQSKEKITTLKMSYI